MFNFITLIDILGTVAFALSGIRLAFNKEFDWFGAFVVGAVTAMGGGTLRDIFLGVRPFWMLDPQYLIWIGIAVVGAIVFKRYLNRIAGTIYLFDTVGLGFFMIVGLEKTLDMGLPWWTAIINGMITGAVGGIIRDVLINEVPLIFHKEIYATACLIGGGALFLGKYLGMSPVGYEIVGVATVIIVRAISTKYHIGLPNLKKEDLE